MIKLPEGIIPIQPTGPLWTTYLSKTKKDFNLVAKILEENNYIKTEDKKEFKFTHKDANVYGPIKNICLDKSWMWAPLKPGKETYKKILFIIGLVPDKDWYYHDIVTSHIPDMMKIIKHFTTIDVSTIQLDYKKGIDVLDDLAIQTGRPKGAYKSNNELGKYFEFRIAFDNNEYNK